MKNAIIIHGKPSKEIYYSDKFPPSSNFAWIPWIQKQLIVRDVKADAPEMPHAYEPDYDLWRTEFERFDITSFTTLIGHSAGGGFLIRWLSENRDARVGKLVLVAPSIDPFKESVTGFCDFDIDPHLRERTEECVILASDNDSQNISRSVEALRNAIAGVRIEILPGYGHFIPEHMGRIEFPELLAEVVEISA
ncbi:alpha/beta hydrolase [Pelagibacterium halotolerans]|uniref:alpha/beta hydrolase n=1 Tax=Pelagibacterium halotolerans TaxID=531813 RepID=UPI00384CC841